MKRRDFLRSLVATTTVAAITPMSLFETGDERWARVARPGAWIEGETFYMTKAPCFKNFPGMTVRDCEFVMLEEVDALIHLNEGCEGLTIQNCIFRGPQRDRFGNIQENYASTGMIRVETPEETRGREDMHRRMAEGSREVREVLQKRLVLAQNEREREVVNGFLRAQDAVDEMLGVAA